MAASFDHANGVGTKTAAGTSHTVNYPTTVEDDILIVTFSGNGVATVTPPTSSISWTQIYYTNTGNAASGAWWGKQIASPVSSGSWGTSSSRQGTWWVVEATGVDTTTPVDVVGTVNSGTSTDPTHGGITPGETDTALMYVHNARAQSMSGLTPPSGMTEHYDDGTSGGGSSALYVASEDLASASATGSRTPSALSSSVAWTANLFTLAPAAGGTNATATPSVVAMTLTAPSATPSASSTQAATVAAFTLAAPSATPSASADVAGVVVPFTTATPSATTTATAEVAASVVPFTVTIPQPTAITAGNATVTPAATGMTLTAPSATPSASSSVSPAVVGMTSAAPAVTPSAASAVSPAVVTQVATYPAATITASSAVSPAVVAMIAAYPQPTAITAGNATVTPSVAAFTVAVPAAVGSASSTVSPAAVTATVAMPAATTLLGGTVTPAAIAMTAAFAAATAAADSSVSPSVVAMTITIPTPDGVGEITVPTWVHFEGSGTGAGVLEAGTVRAFGLEGRPVTGGGLE